VRVRRGPHIAQQADRQRGPLDLSRVGRHVSRLHLQFGTTRIPRGLSHHGRFLRREPGAVEMASAPDGAAGPGDARSAWLLKTLVFAMFAMFAMTTDSVGTVIPEAIREFDLGLTAAGSFQYATMSGIAISAIGLGFLADRLGRKWTILIGLVMFGISSAAFAAGHDFLFFVILLFVSGLGIGIFKSGALALIGDLSRSTAGGRGGHSTGRVLCSPIPA